MAVTISSMLVVSPTRFFSNRLKWSRQVPQTKNFEARRFIGFQVFKHIRAIDGEFYAVVYEYEPPQLVTHFL
jgi:hypothetical protein